MDCAVIQQEFVSYIYKEMDAEQQKIWQQHIQDCALCGSEFADWNKTLGIVSLGSLSVPEKTAKRKGTIKQVMLRIIPIAAVLFISFALGFAFARLYLPKQITLSQNVSPSNIHETLMILVQNQKYRQNLSQGQLKLIQKMEKKLVENTNFNEQIDDLHNLEQLEYNGQLEAIIAEQKNFIKKYPNSVLFDTVHVSLAEHLLKNQNYQEASGIYKNILDNMFLNPHERGECMWKLATCYQQNNQDDKYKKTLIEIEKEPSYGIFRANAIKYLAENDYNQFQFLTAYNRYQNYLEIANVQDEEVKRKLEWIRYHERDNYYPLVLYVEAQQKGTSAYYGLSIIISQYPDSPIAFDAFKLYMQNQEEYLFEMPNKPFPTSQDPKTLLPYLEEIATQQKTEDISKFAKYYQGKIWQKQNKNFSQAVKIYQEVISESSNYRLQEAAYKNISDIENNWQYK